MSIVDLLPELEARVLGALVYDRQRIGSLPHGFAGSVFQLPHYAEIFDRLRAGEDVGTQLEKAAQDIDCGQDPSGWREASEVLFLVAKLRRSSSFAGSIVEAAGAVMSSEGGFPDEQVLPMIERSARAILNEVAVRQPPGVSEGGGGNTLRSHLESGAIVPVSVAIDHTIQRMEVLAAMGTSTGLRALDHHISGLRRGDVIVIGARPGMGKTALALNLSTRLAAKTQLPVLYFCLADGIEATIERSLAILTGVDGGRHRRGTLQPRDRGRLAEGAGLLRQAPLFLCGALELNIEELANRCRAQRQETGLALVVVDPIHNIRAMGGKESPTDMRRVFMDLRKLARELDATFLLLSELNRGPESRKDKRPMMPDLIDKGRLEEIADLVMFLYRDEYYLRELTPEDRLGVAELIIAKYTRGPTGTVEVSFRAETGKFDDLADAPRLPF